MRFFIKREIFCILEQGNLIHLSADLTNDEGKIRRFIGSTWNKVKHAAALRKNFTDDKYVEVTQKLLVSDYHEFATFSYHHSCYKNYTAAKRPK